jgi:hypothetical protein
MTFQFWRVQKGTHTAPLNHVGLNILACVCRHWHGAYTRAGAFTSCTSHSQRIFTLCSATRAGGTA